MSLQMSLTSAKFEAHSYIQYALMAKRILSSTMKNNNNILKFLRCPQTKQELHVSEVSTSYCKGPHLITPDKKNKYPIVSGIPRFISGKNYADNFGMQWNHFRKTQLDSTTGIPISANRFWSATGWDAKELRNKWVLDAGCGSGRFAEIALAAGANVVAVDYSSAVDALQANLQPHPNLYIVQADIYSLPFPDNFFDFVYSLGVLQHTPNVEGAFKALIPVLKGSGQICVDFYWKRFRTLMHSKYLVRPVTKRLSKKWLFSFLERHITKLLFASRVLARVPLIGVAIKRLVPVADYTGVFPLSDEQLIEWALLDTFDMMSPTYDNPQSTKTVKYFFQNSGLIDIEVFHASHLVGRGTKPKISRIPFNTDVTSYHSQIKI